MEVLEALRRSDSPVKDTEVERVETDNSDGPEVSGRSPVEVPDEKVTPDATELLEPAEETELALNLDLARQSLLTGCFDGGCVSGNGADLPSSSPPVGVESTAPHI